MSRTHIVGRSSWTQSLREQISQVARFSSSVLITGPSGTGKEFRSSLRAFPAAHEKNKLRLFDTSINKAVGFRDVIKSPVIVRAAVQ